MTPASNPYDGLIEHLRRIARLNFDNPDLAIEWQAAEALSRLTRDVEEAKEALRPFAAFRLSGFSGPMMEVCQPDSDNPSPRIDYLERKDFERADATLTRLSRPTDLGAAKKVGEA